MHLSTRLRGLDDPFGIMTRLLTPLVGQVAPGATPSGGGIVPGGSNTSVTTAVSTQVSPQISPVFVQQSNPSNSPVGAATAQTTGTPITGAIPGFDTASGYLPTGTPALPAVPQAPINMNALTLGALALVGVAFVVKNRKGAKGKRR